MHGQCSEAEVLSYGQLAIAPVLGVAQQDAEAEDLFGRKDACIAATDHDRPVLRTYLAGYAPKQRGLPAAVRTDDTDDLTGSELERYGLEQSVTTEADVEAADDEQGGRIGRG